MTTLWNQAAKSLQGFGGVSRTLTVRKTGLPFFDALRLYGAMDLYIGLREDVVVSDLGNRWTLAGRCRTKRIESRDKHAFNIVFSKKKPKAEEFCRTLSTTLETGAPFPNDRDVYVPAVKGLASLDASLQSGIRGLSASRYDWMQTGQTGESTSCVAAMRLSDGLLAFAGKKRTEKVGDVVFLPLFEGPIDLGRIVSPLNVWHGKPNILCSQALAILALKNALFAEGYEDRLSAVAFRIPTLALVKTEPFWVDRNCGHSRRKDELIFHG